MKSIRTRLLVSFGLLLSVPLTVFNLVFVLSSLDQSRAQILRQLSSVASLKEDAILSWEKQLHRSVVSILARERLDQASTAAPNSRLKDEIVLADLLDELFVVDASGRVTASSSPANVGKLLNDKEYFAGLFTHGYVSPPFYDLTKASMEVVAAAPVVRGGQTAGSLVGRADLSVLDQVMAERTGLGKTGQTYLVGTNSTLITATRDRARNSTVRIAGVDEAAQRRGTIEQTYRNEAGVGMVATFRWIDSLKVVLVAEQEQSEAYAPAMGVLTANLWIEGAFVLLALLGSLIVTRSLVRPLSDLTETALAISGGDLTRLAREDGPRETALVGRAFNTMTTRLRGSIAQLTTYQANLEGLVAERTTDLVIARNRAEESDRLKSTFLATMSHELRTPLNSIIGFTGILSQGMVGPLNDEQRKQLGFVMTSARHLLDLISDILDISKIEAGQFRVEALPYDLEKVITKSIKSVEPLAQKRGLHLTAEGPPLPGPLVGDARRVEQVLLNLLSNALKFTESGSVAVRHLVEGTMVKVEVKDTGKGIGHRDLSKLFKPFQQLDSGLDRLHQGTGLGLSICKRLMELMGGTINVHSTLGEGSTFWFELPLSLPEEKP